MPGSVHAELSDDFWIQSCSEVLQNAHSHRNCVCIIHKHLTCQFYLDYLLRSICVFFARVFVALIIVTCECHHFKSLILKKFTLTFLMKFCVQELGLCAENGAMCGSVPLHVLSIDISLSPSILKSTWPLHAFRKAPSCTQAGRKGWCSVVRHYSTLLLTGASSAHGCGPLSGLLLWL